MDNRQLTDPLRSLEERLHAIAPRDVSAEAMDHFDDTIDKFSVDAPEASLGIIEKHPATRGGRTAWVWSSAAAIVFLAAVTLPNMWNKDDTTNHLAANEPSILNEETSKFTLLKSVNRVDAYEHDGLIIPDDGGTPHYRHRYHIVDEEEVRDKETGTIVILRQPRQEVVTLPVTQF